MKRVEKTSNGPGSVRMRKAPRHAFTELNFEVLFIEYEKEGRARKTALAQKLWHTILESQIETGGPFMTSKGHANSK